MCKVSVIVPIYNAQKYIHKCVKSIINQTYKNLEIILVNDGSTDKSDEICQQLSTIDNRIIVLNESNLGVSAARNFGLEKASGNFITFIDIDDYIENSYIKELLDCLMKNKVDISYCSALSENENGEILNVEYNNDYLISSPDYDWNSEYSHCVVRGALYRRSVIKKIRFDEDLSVGEDTLFFAKAINNSQKIYCLKDALYHYVIYNFSVSHGKFDKKKMDEIVSWKRICRLSNETAKVACALRCQAIIQKYYTSSSFRDKYYKEVKKVYKNFFPYVFIYFLSKNKIRILIKNFFFICSPAIYSKTWNHFL